MTSPPGTTGDTVIPGNGVVTGSSGVNDPDVDHPRTCRPPVESGEFRRRVTGRDGTEKDHGLK